LSSFKEASGSLVCRSDSTPRGGFEGHGGRLSFDHPARTGHSAAQRVRAAECHSAGKRGPAVRLVATDLPNFQTPPPSDDDIGS
jgi:hypothetical protein